MMMRPSVSTPSQSSRSRRTCRARSLISSRDSIVIRSLLNHAFQLLESVNHHVRLGFEQLLGTAIAKGHGAGQRTGILTGQHVTFAVANHDRFGGLTV